MKSGDGVGESEFQAKGTAGTKAILSLKKLGLIKELKTAEYSSKGLSSKSKHHSQPISQPT